MIDWTSEKILPTGICRSFESYRVSIPSLKFFNAFFEKYRAPYLCIVFRARTSSISRDIEDLQSRFLTRKIDTKATVEWWRRDTYEFFPREHSSFVFDAFFFTRRWIFVPCKETYFFFIDDNLPFREKKKKKKTDMHTFFGCTKFFFEKWISTRDRSSRKSIKNMGK